MTLRTAGSVARSCRVRLRWTRTPLRTETRCSHEQAPQPPATIRSFRATRPDRQMIDPPKPQDTYSNINQDVPLSGGGETKDVDMDMDSLAACVLSLPKLASLECPTLPRGTRHPSTNQAHEGWTYWRSLHFRHLKACTSGTTKSRNWLQIWACRAGRRART